MATREADAAPAPLSDAPPASVAAVAPAASAAAAPRKRKAAAPAGPASTGNAKAKAAATATTTTAATAKAKAGAKSDAPSQSPAKKQKTARQRKASYPSCYDLSPPSDDDDDYDHVANRGGQKRAMNAATKTAPAKKAPAKKGPAKKAPAKLAAPSAKATADEPEEGAWYITMGDEGDLSSDGATGPAPKATSTTNSPRGKSADDVAKKKSEDEIYGKDYFQVKMLAEMGAELAELQRSMKGADPEDKEMMEEQIMDGKESLLQVRQQLGLKDPFNSPHVRRRERMSVRELMMIGVMDPDPLAIAFALNRNPAMISKIVNKGELPESLSREMAERGICTW